MDDKRISVREWQEQYRAGAFTSRDRSAQVKAGWYDWFCRDEALAGRLKKLAPVIMGITHPFILDNYYLWLKNNCPVSGPLYDDVRFEPLSGERGGKYFLVSRGSPHEREAWALTTERYGFAAAEFQCARVRDMVKYINRLAEELEQGVEPEFIAEKNAVTEFVRAYERRAIPGLAIYREGEHLFSFPSASDREARRVAVSSSLENIPAGYKADQAMRYGDFYIFMKESPAKRFYIAYGSNLNLKQMEYRCPTAKIAGRTRLEDHRLRFRGWPDHAFATVELSKGDFVPALIWEIQPEDERSLDHYEGYPSQYRKETLTVNVGGKPVSAMIYIMNERYPYNDPSESYYQTILTGYKDVGFAQKYLDAAIRINLAKASPNATADEDGESGRLTPKIKQQIMAIRKTGETNMLDVNTLQIIANREGYHELVVYLEDHRKEYVHFVLTGEENGGDAK